MRLDSNKAFPHPVLRPENDDYVSGNFEVSVEHGQVETSEGAGHRFTSSFNCTSDSIKKLIAEKKAEYVFIAHCRSTLLRVVERSFEPNINIDIPYKNIAVAVEFDAYVRAIEDIADYSTSELHPFFSDDSVEISKDSVLAQDYPKSWYVNRDSLPSLGSFVTFEEDKEKKHTKPGTWTVVAGDEKFHIFLSSDIFEPFLQSTKHGELGRSARFNLMSLSAITHLIFLLAQGEEMDQEYAHKFREHCLNKGYELDRNCDPHQIAQDILSSESSTPLKWLQHSLEASGGDE